MRWQSSGLLTQADSCGSAVSCSRTGFWGPHLTVLAGTDRQSNGKAEEGRQNPEARPFSSGLTRYAFLDALRAAGGPDRQRSQGRPAPACAVLTPHPSKSEGSLRLPGMAAGLAGSYLSPSKKREKADWEETDADDDLPSGIARLLCERAALGAGDVCHLRITSREENTTDS